MMLPERTVVNLVDAGFSPHSARVRAAMVQLDQDGVAEFVNTGGNVMCLMTQPDDGVLIGEDGCAEDGFVWCVDHDASGDTGGVNYSVSTDTSEWSVQDWIRVFTRVLHDPTNTQPFFIRGGALWGVFHVQATDY